jgi:hypothetical protein
VSPSLIYPPLLAKGKTPTHNENDISSMGTMCSCHLEQPSMQPAVSMRRESTAFSNGGSSFVSERPSNSRRPQTVLSPLSTRSSARNPPMFQSSRSRVWGPLASSTPRANNTSILMSVPQPDPSTSHRNTGTSEGGMESVQTLLSTWDDSGEHHGGHDHDDSTEKFEPLQLPSAFAELLAGSRNAPNT